jgi:hypothetical protein
VHHGGHRPNRKQNEGEQVNRTEQLAKTPSPRTGLFARFASLLGAKALVGSKGGGRSTLRVVGLACLLCGLSLALAGGAQASKVIYFTFGSTGSLGGQFGRSATQSNMEPHWIAVNALGTGPANPGDVYVVDEANQRIERFDADGNFISAWGADVNSPAGGSAYEICVVAANCKAGVAAAGNGAASGDGDLSTPEGVAVDEDTGNVYVSDRENRRIDEYDGAGVFIRSFGFDVDATTAGTGYEVCPATDVCKAGLAGSGTGQYGSGSGGSDFFGLAVSSPDGDPASGTVFLADESNRRVDTFKLDGTSPSSFGSTVNFASGQPTKIAVDSRGIVYTSDTTGSGRIDRYDSSNANGGGVGFLVPIPAPPLLVGSGAPTIGLAVEADSDGSGPDTDVLDVLRLPAEGGVRVQQFGPINKPGLTAPPAAVDDEHQAIAKQFDKTFGLAANRLTGRLYIPSMEGNSTNLFVTVVTDPPGNSPTAITGEAQQGAVSYTEDLEGSVNPNEFKVKDCHFEYGPTTAYGVSVPCSPPPAKLGEGNGSVAVGSETEPLEPQATYHYRLVAANAGASDTGQDRTFTAGAAPFENCANSAIRREQGIRAMILPDCMAFEQVSPPMKYDSYARFPALSANGDRALLNIGASVADTPDFASVKAYYVAVRTPSGWVTERAAVAPSEYSAGPKVAAEGGQFSPNFDYWGNIPQTALQHGSGVAQVFRESLDGSRDPLSELFQVRAGELGQVASGVLYASAADFSHVYFSMGKNTTLLPGDLPASTGEFGFNTIYVAHRTEGGVPALELLTRDASGKVWGGSCGASLGFQVGTLGSHEQGAVSADGKRAFFTTRSGQTSTTETCRTTNPLRILRRVETPTGVHIDDPIVSECSRIAPPCETVQGGDEFVAASQEGTKLFFITSRQLANSDLDSSPDLYMYDYARPLAERLTQLSAGDASDPERGKNAGVLGAMAVAGDGSHTYFVAGGVLTTTPNVAGKTAQAGQPNLYVYERDPAHPAGRTAFIGVVSENDAYTSPAGDGQLALPERGANPGDNAVGGDGHILVFSTDASLLGEDTDGGHADIYRYDSNSGDLSLISGGTTGAPSANGAFDIATPVAELFAQAKGPDSAELSRWASEDGQTIAFTSKEPLVPGTPSNQGLNYDYLWKNGNLVRLPGQEAGSSFVSLLLSPSGDEVAFSTFAQLTASDGDSARDSYVARVGGGFAAPVASEPCQGETCQGAPSAAPGAQRAMTASLAGQGNVSEKKHATKHKKHRGKKRDKRKRHASPDRRGGHR